MKITVERETLGNGLQHVLSAVNGRTSMAILNNVLLEARDGSLILTTTNLDYGIRCQLSAEVHEEGRLTLPAKKLATIVKALSNPSIDLETLKDGTQAKISSGGAVFRLLGLAAEDFPQLPNLEAGQHFLCPSADLARMIQSVHFAQSNDEQRYILNGIYCLFENDSMVFVATDGRRLATISRPAMDGSGSLIIPSRTIDELARLLDLGEEVSMAFNGRQITAEIQGRGDGGLQSVYLVSKLVEGNYPNYRQVIPGVMDSRVVISREFFLEAIQRAAIVASDRSQSISLKFTENLLELSASSAEFGESHERMAIAYGTQKPTEIIFNPRYLIEPLRAIDDDEITFEFRDSFSPGVIRGSHGFLCVIMPLRIGA